MADPIRRKKIEQISTLLQGALRAEAQVGLKLNIRQSALDKVLSMLPSITSPTVANLSDGDWVSVESVIAEAKVRDLIPELLAEGAEGIIEYPLNKVI